MKAGVPGTRADFGAIASLFPGNLTRKAAGLPPLRARHGTIQGPKVKTEPFSLRFVQISTVPVRFASTSGQADGELVPR